MLRERWQTQAGVGILIAGVGQREIALTSPLINKCMSRKIEQDNIANLGLCEADLRNQGFDKLFSCKLTLDRVAHREETICLRECSPAIGPAHGHRFLHIAVVETCYLDNGLHL